MKCAVLYALLFFIPVQLQAATGAQKPQLPFSITIRLDRAAIWVGDSVQYTVEVIHPPNVQFAVENLKKENLALSPFVVRNVRVEEREWRDNKKLLEVILLLTTYETGKSELQIPPLALYYFKRDGGISEKEARAQAIRIPPQRIALRSTLPGGQARLREFKPMDPVDPSRAIGALLLGLVGIASIGSYATLRMWRAVHRDKTIKRPSSWRARARWTNEGLRRIREMAHESPEDMETFYAESGRFLREYLTEWLDVEARGLTPAEAEEALRQARWNGDFAQQVRIVLEQCEDARYRKRDGRATDEDRYKSVVDSLERAIQMALRAK